MHGNVFLSWVTSKNIYIAILMPKNEPVGGIVVVYVPEFIPGEA